MEQGEIMDNQPASGLKQEWLKHTANYKHFSSISFFFAVLVLSANVIYKHFTAWQLFLFYLFVVFSDVLFFGFIWSYITKFTFDKDCFSFVQGSSIFKSKKVHYEKVIYASKHRRGYSYNLALEVWFGRQPVVFWERLPSVEGRTEEIYYGEGMQAHYWTRKPGKIDELAGFIDMYNAQAKID
jgi:hypothetical protein